MEGYGRGARGRGGRGNDDRERPGGGGGGGRGRGRGGSGGGGHGGGRGGGRGYQQRYSPHPHQHHQQQPHHYQQQQQQPNYQRQVNQWAQGPPPSSGRGGPAWRPSHSGPVGRPQAPVGTTHPITGAGGSYAARLQPSSAAAAADPGTIVPKMQSLKVSGQTSQSSNTEGLVPIQRPDNGGTVFTRVVNILVNHFKVEFNPETIIYHYDVDVKPEVASARGRPVKISKSNMCLLVEKLFAENPNFPLDMIGYDGEKNVFSAASLPVGEFKVDLSDVDDTRCRLYIFSVTRVNQLKLHKLKDYLAGNLLQIPRDVLQGMDIVMKENPRRHLVSMGRSFHQRDPETEPDCDLGYGIAASRGFQHSLKPTSQGLALCLDYSVLAVRKRMPVLDFLVEHDERFTLYNFCRMRRQIESALKGLKVTVIHRRTKQKYIVSGLTEQRACDISFSVEDPHGQAPPKTVHLVDYFQDKYRLNVRYKDIPCLKLGKGSKANYVPPELCVLVEGQRYPKDNLDRDSALLLKNMSLASPQDRQRRICGMLQDGNGPCGGGICHNFDIDVEMNMTRVQGRVINPPQLKLRAQDGRVSAVNVDRESCQWNLVRNSVVEGKSLVRWAVLDLSSRERYDRLNADSFIPKFVARCNKLGLHMKEPLFVEQSGMSVLSSVGSLTHLLDNVYHRAQRNLELLFVVMTRKDPGYKNIKWVSETKIGIVTQCCLSKMANKAQDQYLANLGMKINAKLGGSNVELLQQLPLFEDQSHVMLIGADVNHPRPLDFSSPSIAAVVGSMNLAANKYSPRVRFQQHRSEKIISFGEICLELIDTYEKVNGSKPKKIVIFRDGVSEGQFDMVLNEELLDLKMALQGRNYSPTITVVVAQKRHQTRLFPQNPGDGSSRGNNIPPGTVVDRTIVHPFEFDFYLCSHYGSIGTSKPTHYHVLWDEHSFTSDKLQELIYKLCFTFARCCKPVSLVPPVYYADLLAYRGRLYYDAVMEKQSSSGTSSSSFATSSSSTSGTSFDETICKLHSDLENNMFFI